MQHLLEVEEQEEDVGQEEETHTDHHQCEVAPQHHYQQDVGDDGYQGEHDLSDELQDLPGVLSPLVLSPLTPVSVVVVVDLTVQLLIIMIVVLIMVM